MAKGLSGDAFPVALKDLYGGLREMAQNKSSREIVQLRIRYLLLLALLAGDAHGYEVMKRAKALGLGDMSISPGSVYPLLRKLEEEGLVKSRREIQRGRSIRVYSLTEKGYQELMNTVLDVVDALLSAFKVHVNLLLELKEKERLEWIQRAAPKETLVLREKLKELEEVVRRALEIL